MVYAKGYDPKTGDVWAKRIRPSSPALPTPSATGYRVRRPSVRAAGATLPHASAAPAPASPSAVLKEWVSPQPFATKIACSGLAGAELALSAPHSRSAQRSGSGRGYRWRANGLARPS